MAIATTYGFKGFITKTHERATIPHDLTAAVITGQIAGLIMAAVMMLVFAFVLGYSPLYPVQVIGSLVFGEDALKGVYWPAVVAGLFLHQLGPALFWSLVFGFAAYYMKTTNVSEFLILGFVVGVLSQLVDVDGILPLLYPALYGHNIWAEEVPNIWSWAAHIVYGLSLGLYPKMDKYLARPG